MSAAERWYADLRAWLEWHDGVPPDAACDVGVTPAIYWLLFGEASAQYVFRDSFPAPRGWWDVPRRLARRWHWRRWRLRRVTFVGFGEPWPAAPNPG